MAKLQGKDSVNTQKRKEKQAEIARLHEKTFRAWINSHLRKRSLVVNNLFTDLKDGINLIHILEQLSGEKCTGKYNKTPKMDVHKLENITIAVDFCKQFFNISIRSQDIFDGNEKIILGLIWRMILHFQVAGNKGKEEDSGSAQRAKAAKQKLLEWLQQQTKGHRDVNIQNFDSSWYDGMGFCALVHAFDPSLIDFNSLNKDNKKENLIKAFQLAEKHLDIPSLLDPEDIVQTDEDLIPDEQCFITYLSQFPVAFLGKQGKDLEKEKQEAERLRLEAEAKRREEERLRAEEEKRRREEEERERERRRKEEADALDAERAAREAADRARLEAERRAKEAEDENLRRQEEEARRAEKERRKAEKARLAEQEKDEEAARKRREEEEAFEAERKRLQAENEALRKKLRRIGTLQVGVVEARGLKKADHLLGGKSDPYCVLFVERQKEKTRTVKKCLNPKWDAKFEFYVSDKDASLEVDVFDWNRILADDFLGKVTIPVSSLSDGKDTEAWYTLEGKKKGDKVSGEVKLNLRYNLEQ